MRENIVLENGESKEFVIDSKDNVQCRYEMLREGELRTEKTIEEIARKYGYSSDSYYNYRTRFHEEGIDGLKDKKRGPKGPSKVKEDVVRRIISFRLKKPEMNVYEITEQLNKELNCENKTTVCVRSVGQVLKRYGLSKKTIVKTLPKNQK